MLPNCLDYDNAFQSRVEQTRHMIIDCHNHLGVDPGDELTQSAEDLLHRMDEASIDVAVVFPFSGCRDLAEGNEYVRQAVSDYPDRLVRFLGVNPRDHRGRTTDDIAEVLEASRAEGVVIDPRIHHFSLGPELMDPLMRACALLGTPILVHLVGHGLDDCSPIVDLAMRHPDVAVVASPLIYSPGWERIAVAADNLYADTAKPLHPRQLDRLVGTLGSERTLPSRGSTY